MIESPPAPKNWVKIYEAPFGDNGEGWFTSYSCIRNKQLAKMDVIWLGPNHDTVDIRVREYPGMKPDQGKSEKVIEITVPVSDARQKIDETAESWTTAIDNE